MTVGGKIKWTPPRKAGGIPRVSTKLSLSMENWQGDAGREISIFPLQLTTSRNGNLTWLIHSLLEVI